MGEVYPQASPGHTTFPHDIAMGMDLSRTARMLGCMAGRACCPGPSKARIAERECTYGVCVQRIDTCPATTRPDIQPVHRDSPLSARAGVLAGWRRAGV